MKTIGLINLNPGRKLIVLPNDELEYIKEKVSLGWTPDTIIGRNEKHISCSMRTLYRIFKRSNVLDVTSLPMKGKRHPNGYVERRGKAGRLGSGSFRAASGLSQLP